MYLSNCPFPLCSIARHCPRMLLVWSVVLLAACFEPPPANVSQTFSCEDVRQVQIWRARIRDNFAAVQQLTSAHNPEAADALATIRGMRDLHLRLRQYFMTEPMPDCMQQAVRIYVDGLEPLERSGDRVKDLQDSMSNVATTVDRFADAVRTAMPLWALEAQRAASMPR
ncbi:MAG: hypothetical protein EON50_01605 [Acidovorax sp.]|nr:MAG: hypothetical protein EON50_01605 [Acidovorax sp.]